MKTKYIHFFTKKSFNSFRSFRHYFSTKTDAQNLPNTFYDILELKSNCTQREIRKNYLRLAKTYHPDIYKGSDKDRFKRIKEAYETLKSPEKREEYDRKENVQSTETDSKRPDSGFSNGETVEDNKSEGANLYKDWDQESKKNLDMEYQKFMGKESNINPEEIITSEDPLIQQMNEVEKARMDYQNMRNNMELHHLKYSHQQGFRETLNDTINILNTAHKIKTEPEDIKKEREESSAKRNKRRMFWLQCVIFVVALPYIINAAAHRAYVRREKEKRELVLKKIQNEMEIKDLHQRIVFEDK